MIVINPDNLLEVASEEYNSTNEEENQKIDAEVSSAAHAVGAGPRTPLPKISSKEIKTSFLFFFFSIRAGVSVCG